MNENIRKIWNRITTVLVVLIMILAILLAGVRLTGLQVFTVLSGSMEPAYHVGSLIYVKDVDPYKLESGDVITFMLDENTIATHRIVEVISDENDASVIQFRTKGDANNTADGGLVYYKNVIGKPVFTVPYLGYVANYIQNPPGKYITLIICAVILLLTFIPEILADSESNDNGSNQNG